jgi:hypothetical protein
MSFIWECQQQMIFFLYPDVHLFFFFWNVDRIVIICYINFSLSNDEAAPLICSQMLVKFYVTIFIGIPTIGYNSER